MKAKPTYQELEKEIEELRKKLSNKNNEEDFKEKRKEVEQALKESENRLKAFSDVSSEAIFFSEKGTCIEANQRASELFGYSYNELIGIFGTDIIAPESKKNVTKNILSGYEKPYDAIAQKKDGTTFHAEFHGRRYNYKGKKIRVTAVVDITERKNAEEIIKESKENYRLLTEIMKDVVVRISTTGKLLYVSPATEKFGGYKPEEEIGNEMSKYFAHENDYHQAVKLITEVVKTHKSGNFEFMYKPKNKAPFPVEHTFVPLISNNKVYAIQMVLRDITERKEVEQALKLNEKKYRVLFEKSRNATLILQNGKFIFYNKAASILFDIKNTQLEITPELLSPKYQQDGQPSEIKAQENITIALKQGFYKFEWIHKHFDNTEFPTEIWLTAILYENKTSLHVVVIDLTETKRKEKLLKLQKQKIEEAHKNITDSIIYAETIQRALLTSKKIIDNYLNEYFIFNKPKEKVSGDFYYINKIGKHIIIAVADCTGHGVPGGFLTMLGITYLHETTKNKTVYNPATVLEILRERFKKTFKEFGSNNNNGLDIALCAINTETNILQYAGAFNPLIIIRNEELIEYKATRNPIGFYPEEKTFKNNEIQLQNNDLIYIYSDGFQDQFGERDNKKFRSVKFKELLLEIHDLPMEIQKNKLNNVFMKWKGKNEQTDDILIFGMQFNKDNENKRC